MGVHVMHGEMVPAFIHRVITGTAAQIFGVIPNLILAYTDISCMKPECGLALSPRKVEYLKFIFGREGMVRTNEIASAFTVDPSTITKTLAELTGSGYITHVPYRGVCLTDAGKHHAEFLVKRHRILSLILVRYGLSDEAACREVSRFESLVTKDAIDTLCRAMGHPRNGVCGEITHDDGCMMNEGSANQTGSL
jgi:DtxR family transcriptional regulator, Mn-dependent transcriptional regulator